MSRFHLIGAAAAALVSLPGVASAAFLPGPNAIASFFTTDDFVQHVIVAQSTGAVTEVYFQWGVGNGGVSAAPLFTDASIKGLSGYFTPSDTFRHVIYWKSDNSVRERFYNPFLGAGDDKLCDTSTLPAGSSGNHTIVALTAYTTSDGYQHAVFATAYGNVYEFLWNTQTGGGYHVGLITSQFPVGSIVSIAGYESTDDHQEHVIVATTSNSLTDLKFKGDPLTVGFSFTSVPLTGSTFTGIVSIGADYLPGWGGWQSNSVAIGDGQDYDIGLYNWGTSGFQAGGLDDPADATRSVDLNYAPGHGGAAPARIVSRAGSSGALTYYNQSYGGSWWGPYSLGTW